MRMRPQKIDKSNPSQAFWEEVGHFQGRLDHGDFKNLLLSLLYLRSLANKTRDWTDVVGTGYSANTFTAIDEALERNLGLENRTILVDTAMLGGLFAAMQRLEPGDIPDVFEFCIEKFSQTDGRTGGDYCSPRWLKALMVKLAAPRKGLAYDPCCGSGGLLAHAWMHAAKEGGELRLFGQESNLSTRRIGIMNLAVRGIECSFGADHANTFQTDLHSNLKADFVLANPPFNVENWTSAEASHQSWDFGMPPINNANFAWIQHFVRHLASNGTAVFTMSNGALSSKTCGEGDIRRAIVEAGLVDCIIGLPARLFHSTRIPASIWVLKNGRQKQQQCLFINAQNLGRMVDRVHSVLNDDELESIVGAYHAWRGNSGVPYKNIPGFSNVSEVDEIRANNYILTPGRYVPVSLNTMTAEVPAEKIASLTKQLDAQFKESIRLEQLIRMHLAQADHGH